MENLYNELKSGRSAEELVAEFTKSLNEAENLIKEEYKAEQARIAKAQEEAKTKQKREDIAESIADLFDTLNRYYGDQIPELSEIDDEAFYALADLVIISMDLQATGVGDLLNIKTKATKSADPFASFFSQYGL